MRIAWSLPFFVALFLQPASAQVAQQENHTYDELGRLTSTTNTGTSLNGETRSICYDEAGNRVEFDVRTNGATTTCSVPTQQTPPSGPPEATEGSSPPEPQNYAPTTEPDVATGNCRDFASTDVLINDDDHEQDALTIIAIEFDYGDSTASAIIDQANNDINVVFPATAGNSARYTYTIQDTANNTAQGVLRVESDATCTPLL